MKDSIVEKLKLLLPFCWLLAAVIFVVYKLTTEYDHLEKWRVICLSIGGTLMLSILIAFIGFNIYFRSRRKRLAQISES
ncbi:hypothetical protein [Roseivirga sp. UBA1976]|uniref:hypothetical protein n=1 Tax=Roseivirga sp. UBA1976 TaxID=1947386 RepID=UPI00257CB66F|nr:hypothetical protein [Roseivirga sp. UBA1976]|tara:strand:- start:374 stop:610 length:237 start_codon:yes stop_codon:yes gene_type:complete